MRGTIGSGVVRNLMLVGVTVLLSARALAGSYEVREFDSPMTVETVFALTDHALWDKQWHGSPEYDRVSASICNHVKITNLEISVADLPKVRPKKGEQPAAELVKLGVRGRIKNDFGGDKLATMRFEVLSGEEVTAAVNVKISVEDAEERGFKGFASVPASVIPTDPAARLRITMNVEED
jgi:hypothetical protein